MKVVRLAIYGLIFSLIFVVAGWSRLPMETDKVIPFKILHTGHTLSRLEVCGCAIAMEGGMPARGRVEEEEREGVDRFLLFDSGYLFDGEEEMDRQMAALGMQMMSAMGYDGMLVSQTEFRFGIDFLAEQLQATGLQAVCTNIIPPASANPPWQKVLYYDFPRLRVAVIGLIPEDVPFLPAGYQVSDPIEAASEAVQDIGDSADLIIALVSLDRDGELTLAREIDQIPLILSGRQARPSQRSYKSVLSHSGEVGKTLNVIEANYKPTLPQNPFTFLVNVKEIRPELGTDSLIQSLADEFVENLKQQSLAEGKRLKIFAEEKVENLPGNAYIGSASCQSCHEVEHKQWHQTLHRVSLLSLLNKNRQFDPECLSCHVTGYGYPSGFDKVRPLSDLARVGCESCHGPGKLHFENPEDKNLIRSEITDEHCMRCHDQANDPDFQKLRDKRWVGIDHGPAFKKLLKLD